MQKIIIILVLVLLVCGTTLILISLPMPEEVTSLPFALEDGTEGKLVISAPRFLRLGDSTTMVFKIEFTPSDSNSPGESQKIKASLVSTSLDIDPATAVTAIVPVDGTGSFRWKIMAHRDENQLATLWCFREGAAGPELILSREMAFEVKTILGMSYRFFRWILVGIMFLCLCLTALTINKMKQNNKN